MPVDKIGVVLNNEVEELVNKGTAKGKEDIIVGVKRSNGKKGPRYFLDDYGSKEFLRFNSNSYLGLSLDDDIIHAEEEASREFGAGPGAVRFINGTFKAHYDLEKKLAQFHGKEEGMIFSCAYTAMIGVFNALTSKESIIISDELNHNCIINAMKLSRPKKKNIYKHNNMEMLENMVKESIGKCERLLIITDGIFSMRGDCAPLGTISEIVKKYDVKFPQNIMVMIDDSHGVGACGKTGRGTAEVTGTQDSVDVLIGTLGKAFGVNGGYVVTSRKIIRYLREKAVTYIYSNPITVGEAAACIKVLDFIDSDRGRERLKYVNGLTKKFENGLKKLGFEIIESEHPIVPLMIRDTKKTSKLVNYLKQNGVLTTGLNFPVVPDGDQTIRCQINGNHTDYDIKYVLKLLKNFRDDIN